MLGLIAVQNVLLNIERNAEFEFHIIWCRTMVHIETFNLLDTHNFSGVCSSKDYPVVYISFTSIPPWNPNPAIWAWPPTDNDCMFLVLELNISVYWSGPYKLGTPVGNELEFGCKNKFHQNMPLKSSWTRSEDQQTPSLWNVVWLRFLHGLSISWLRHSLFLISSLCILERNGIEDAHTELFFVTYN